MLKERPELAKRYEGLFGKDYLDELRRPVAAFARTRGVTTEAARILANAATTAEVEALFERAAEQFGEVKLPYGDTVGEQAKSELYKIRHLSVGKSAPEIEGQDQDGTRFKLSDYRGKVVLLYFWSEY